MELTHFGHSCLLAEFDGTTLLFDPGNFSHGFEGVTGLSAILITHQHPDHADRERLPALVEANPDAALYADPATAAELGGPWRAVHVGVGVGRHQGGQSVPVGVVRVLVGDQDRRQAGDALEAVREVARVEQQRGGAELGEEA